MATWSSLGPSGFRQSDRVTAITLLSIHPFYKRLYFLSVGVFDPPLLSRKAEADRAHVVAHGQDNGTAAGVQPVCPQGATVFPSPHCVTRQWPLLS